VKSTFFIIASFIFFTSGCGLNITSEPSLLTMDYGQLAEIRESIHIKSPVYEAAYQRLCKEAENAINLPVYSVTNKKGNPPSGDKHDYMSQAPYWWPDPSKPGGLPYIRRDGVRNPESYDSRFDRHRIEMMTDNMMSLTLAWFFTGEERFAVKASDLIETWFIDPATRVNPNMNYAQSIPGITEGRGIGIIETRRYIKIIDAVKLLEGSKSWNRRMTKSLRSWFSDYLEWLVNSENGLDEQAKENNHGTWYDVQVIYYAGFTGKHKLARNTLQKAVESRVNSQIDLFGKQPHELSRTRSFSYSAFNLEALILIGKLGEMAGDGPWGGDPDAAEKIRLACDFLFKYIDRIEEWPYEQITPVEWGRLVPVLSEASRLFDAPGYNLYLESIEDKMQSNDRLIFTNI